MSLGFVIKTVGILAQLMPPYILSHILQNVIGGGVGEILYWGGLMMAFSAVSCTLNVVASRMAAHVSRV